MGKGRSGMNPVSKILSFNREKERVLVKPKKPEQKPERSFREIYLECLREVNEGSDVKLG